MRGDGELSKLRKDLEKNRQEIAALQRRIRALIDKRSAPEQTKSATKKQSQKE
jgi:hypothetical protein